MWRHGAATVWLLTQDERLHGRWLARPAHDAVQQALELLTTTEAGEAVAVEFMQSMAYLLDSFTGVLVFECVDALAGLQKATATCGIAEGWGAPAL